MNNLKRMTKEEKETYLDNIAKQLIKLAEDGIETNEFVFLLNKHNTVFVEGNQYYLKLTKSED